MMFENKLAVVTGGTDGIGLGIAREMRSRGAVVAVIGIDDDRLRRREEEGFEALKADLATPEGIELVVSTLLERDLSILVNNAGIGAHYHTWEDIDLAVVDRGVALNLVAPMHLIARLLPTLKARPQAMIVNVTSGLAIAPSAKSPVYCGTKAGLRSFTIALRAQLARSNVHVMEALPPVVDTRMAATNVHGKMPVAACAREIVEGMAAKRDAVFVGKTRLLRWGYELSPTLARRIMLRY